MKNNSVLDEGKREFKNENYEESVQIFLQEVLKGTPKALQYAGKGMLHTRIETRNDLISKVNCVRITNYLKSELMKKKNAQAFIDLVVAYRRSGYPISNKLKCHYYLKLAQESLTPEDGESRNEIIENETASVNRIMPAIAFKEKLNKLDYFWSMVEPFWIEQYKLNPETNAILENCGSESTRERFSENIFLFDFKKYTAAWCELKNHFKCKSKSVCLIYAEGEFNQPEIIRLVASTMAVYGYEVKVSEWKSIDSIPEDAIVALLGDSEFFAESHKSDEKKHRCYGLIQEHRGVKLWIPWQIPAEISLPEYWETLPPEWQVGWIQLTVSLVDEPLAALNAIAGYVFAEINDRYVVSYLKQLPEKISDSHQKIPQGYKIQPVPKDGDCGYTAFGIDRKSAADLLIENIHLIKEKILLPVEENLHGNKTFRKYLKATGCISVERKKKDILEKIDLYAKDLTVLKAYIRFDVMEKKVDGGWAHPSILQAIAKLKHTKLVLWILGERGVLLPHRHDGFYDYHVANPERSNRKDLLFVNNNHFEKLNFIGYSDEIPSSGIYPYDFSCLKIKNENQYQISEQKLTHQEIIKSLIIEGSPTLNIDSFFEVILKIADESVNLYDYIAPRNSIYILCQKYHINNTITLSDTIQELSSKSSEDCKVLMTLAANILDCFENQKPKNSSLFNQISHLVRSRKPEIIDRVFEIFSQYFYKKRMRFSLIEILVYFNAVLRSMPAQKINRSRLILLLEYLMGWLDETHVQENDTEEAHHLLKTIGIVLGIMKVIDVENVKREAFQEQYYAQLEKLQNKSPESLKPIIQKTIATLIKIPHDEKLLDEILRRGSHLMPFSTCLLSIAFTCFTVITPVGAIGIVANSIDAVKHLYHALKTPVSSHLGKQLHDFQLLLLQLRPDEGVDSLKYCEDFINNLDNKLRMLDKILKTKMKMLLLLGAVDIINDLIIEWNYAPDIQIAAINMIFNMIELAKKSSKNEKEMEVAKDILIAHLRRYCQKKEHRYTALSIAAQEKLEQLGENNSEKDLDCNKKYETAKVDDLFNLTKFCFEERIILDWLSEIFDNLVTIGLGYKNKNAIIEKERKKYFFKFSIFDAFSINMICNIYKINNTKDLCIQLKKINHRFCDILVQTGVETLRLFEREKNKNSIHFQEIFYLAHTGQEIILKELFEKLYDLVTNTKRIPLYLVEMISCVTITFNSMLSEGRLDEFKPGRLIEILNKLMLFLDEIHIQPNDEYEAYHLVKAITFIFSIIKKTKVKNVNIEKIVSYDIVLIKALARCSEKLKPLVAESILALRITPRQKINFLDFILIYYTNELLKLMIYRGLTFVRGEIKNMMFFVTDSCIPEVKQLLVSVFSAFVNRFTTGFSNISFIQKTSNEFIMKAINFSNSLDKQSDKSKTIKFILCRYLKFYAQIINCCDELFDITKQQFGTQKKPLESDVSQHPLPLLFSKKEISHELFDRAKESVASLPNLSISESAFFSKKQEQNLSISPLTPFSAPACHF